MANKEKMGPPTLEMIQGNPYNYTFDEVAKCMGEERAKSLFKTLYKNGVSPKNQTMTIKDIYVGGDTTKYAFELQDGYCIETVCIKRRTGNTVCVSTMVGCPVGCIFCASGKNGFIRNLSPAEIVQQIVLLKERVNRIVFMGMGEPLFNYDNLIKSIHILRDRNGLNFPTDGINVSTVGPVEQLKRLREEHLKIQFTLSLHATDQATRNMIMPHMKSNSIHSVVEAALSYSERHNRKITIAYLLAPGINDRASDVRQLGKWFRGKNVLITGLTVKDFDVLCSIGLFDSEKMNQGIFGFRKYENSSLSYTGIDKHAGEAVGGWDTVLRREEYEALYSKQQATMTDFESILIPEKYRSEKSGNTTEDEIAATVTDNTTAQKQDEEKLAAEKPLEEMLAKVQIGVTVTHKKFGSGAIVWIDSAKKYLRVKFDAGEKQFVYPDAFLMKFLEVK